MPETTLRKLAGRIARDVRPEYAEPREMVLEALLVDARRRGIRTHETGDLTEDTEVSPAMAGQLSATYLERLAVAVWDHHGIDVDAVGLVANDPECSPDPSPAP